ncbi:MAG: hypothetical protein HQM14_20600 [SAR324 cluster bacterium]|nr:hypothetical protein [SAR324 cluster bacterium]
MRAYLQYKIDNFMAKGGASIFLSLLVLFCVMYVVMLVIRYIAVYFFPDATISEINDQIWRVLLQMMDPGAFENDEEASVLQKFIGAMTVFAGMIFFSSLVAFITTEFNERIAMLRKGRSIVLEKGHTVILGFNNRILEIVKELILSNEDEKKRLAVVILSEQDKELMDDFFHENISNTGTSRIVTRSGNISSLVSLRKLGLSHCKSVIVLNPAKPSDNRKQQLNGDSLVLKTILSIASVTGDENAPVIVCEFFEEKNRNLGIGILPEKVVALQADYIMAKILVQTSRNPGLAFVYDHLVGFEGNEIYFYPVPQQGIGMTFGAIKWNFNHSIVLGLRLPDSSHLWNPPANYVLREQEELILAAESFSAIQFEGKPVASAKNFEFSGAVVREKVDSELIIGWSRKVEKLVDEYAAYVIKGSRIDVIVASINKTMRQQIQRILEEYPYLSIELYEDDIHEEGVLQKYRPENYDNVILVTEEIDTGTEELDADTITKLLEFRKYFRMLQEEKNRKVKTQLITEVMDSRNAELIYGSGVRDFFIPDQFISKILAQISQDSRIYVAYEDLFSAYGSEIYIKPISLYFKRFPVKHAFTECMAAAEQRNEVCLGVRIIAHQYDSARNFGITLIPPQTEEFYFVRQDQMIVLAENTS